MRIDIDGLFKEAMEQKDVSKLSALQLLKAAFVNAEKIDGKEIDEEKEIKIIQKMISDCKNDAETYAKVGRTEQSKEELTQANVLEELLPKLTNMEKKDFPSVIHQMIKDKSAVQNYIREHGTLKGFKNDRIKFARPF